MRIGGRAVSVVWPLSGALLLVLLATISPPAGSAVPAWEEISSLESVRVDPALKPLRRGTGVIQGSTGASFQATLQGSPVLLALSAVPVLPGEGVLIGSDAAQPLLTLQAGAARELRPGRWRWTAPDRPGAYALKLESQGGVLHFTALVQYPAEAIRSGSLNGYRIGEYRRIPLRGDPAYLPPEGFVEVGEDDGDILVSPHFSLGQFLCKQPGDPRFVVLSQPLLTKLEALALRMVEAGHSPADLVVMSGYRTPAYNRAIGNTTSYSRHLWGDAADLYLDADGDGDMDDLNGDGRSDLADGRVLAGWVEDVGHEPGVLPGGLALYRRNAAHGPFVHVDARGTRARW